jgi:hypothetical protein
MSNTEALVQARNALCRDERNRAGVEFDPPRLAYVAPPFPPEIDAHHGKNLLGYIRPLRLAEKFEAEILCNGRD